MLNELDVDLEDLEARLYSQVYHVSQEEPPLPQCPTEDVANSANTINLEKTSRYYKMDNFGIQQQVNFVHTNYTDNLLTWKNNVNVQTILNSEFPIVNNSRDIRPLLTQVINVVNPYSNIVLPQGPTNFVEPNIAQRKCPPLVKNRNYERFLRRLNIKENRNLRKCEKRKRQKEKKRLEKLLQISDQNFAHKNQNQNDDQVNVPVEFIDVPDSDSDSCVEVKDNSDLVILCSDDSADDVPATVESKVICKNEEEILTIQKPVDNTIVIENDDDVIFIEPNPAEVIEIDIDPPQRVLNLDAKSVADADASKQSSSDKSTETSSTNSADTFIKVPRLNALKNKQIMTSRERRELLGTPDSTTSNDFLDNPVDVQQNKFNFGLHGSDFGNSQMFLKPKSHTDVYETESSCSTSDMSTPIKTAIFNEIEFELPNKELFDETNLEDFGEYITPNRNNSLEIASILTSNFDQVPTKVTKGRLELLDDSNSSSDDSYVEVTKIKQKLPNLCPIRADTNNSSPVFKNKGHKGKKKTTSDASPESVGTITVSKKNRDKIEEEKRPKKKTKTKKLQITSEPSIKNQANSGDGVTAKRKIDFVDGDTNDEKILQKESKNKKVNSDKSCTEGISTKRKSDQFEVASLEETNFNPKHKILKCRTDETDAKDAQTHSDDHKSENKNNESRAENLLENFVTSNFVILDETVGDGNCDDNSSSSRLDFSDFDDLGDDLNLANCDSSSKHPVQSSTPKKTTRFANYWTSDIDKFHGSWGLENFNVEEIQKSMSDDPDLWKIVDRDRVFVRLSTPRGQRCRRCREVGHVTIQCKNKPAIPSCSLCGVKGHREPRCPNAVCTTCGNPGGYGTYCSKCAYWRNYQCTICNLYGHFDWACPDSWRRYHLTTKPGPIVVPDNNRGKLYQDRWCSGCAKFGHYEHNCRYHNRTHSCTGFDVKQYVDIYDFPKSRPKITLKESLEQVVQDHNLVESSTSADKCKVDNIPEKINISVSNKKSTESHDQEESKQILLPESTGLLNNIFPPFYMVPTYFQQQLHHIRFDKENSVERKKEQSYVPTNEKSSLITDCTVKNKDALLSKNLLDVNPTNGSQLYSERILLFERKFAYLNSRKVKEFINNIKMTTRVNVTITASSEDSAEAGVAILYGNQTDVKAVSNQLQAMLHTMPNDINKIPRASNALHTFLFKHIQDLNNVQGNCKFIFDSIIIKKQQMLMSGKSDNRKMNSINSMYRRLNYLLFGRCKLQDGQTHMGTLQLWFEKTKNPKQFDVGLEDRYNIYESYMYIYRVIRSDDEYRTLCNSVDYYVNREKTHSVSAITRKKRMFFLKKARQIISHCKKYHLNDKLREFNDIENAVIKSDYSKNAYEDFLKYVSYFTKYFSNFRNSKM